MFKPLLLVLSMVAISGCAGKGESAETTGHSAHTNHEIEAIKHPNDPLEDFNRAIWSLNFEYLDPYLLRPVSVGYANYTPSPLRTGIRNFLNNLEEPFKVINNLLTLEGNAALDHFNRFWINSSFGVLGLIDIAGKAGILPANDKQFGDVLGRYGIGHGPYVMLPVIGPITVREGVGDWVDGLYPPLSWLTFPQSVIRGIFNGMETRASLVPQESLLYNSPDPYVFVRDAYLQNKAFTAKGSEQEQIELNDEHLNEDLLDEIDDY